MKAANFRPNSSVNIVVDIGNGCHPTEASPKINKRQLN